MDKRIGVYVESHEGRRLEAYKCPAGYWTYGVGRNLQTNRLTLEETLFLLEHGPGESFINLLMFNDLERCWKEAVGSIGQTFTGWPPARQAVIISMLFNLGLAGFLGFSAMRSALMADPKEIPGKWDIAADESLDSVRAKQLQKRVAREAQMLRTGNWPA